MTAAERLRALQRALARRRMAIALALVAPPALAAIGATAGLSGGAAATLVAILLLAPCAGLGAFVHRRSDAAWLARRLDAQVPAMEDSAALLFADPVALAPLERLQQARLRQRVAVLDVDLRPRWPRGALGASFGLAAAIVFVAWLGSAGVLPSPPAPVSRTTANDTTARIGSIAIAIQPPAYTGLATRRASTLDLEVVEGSRLDWRLRFTPAPPSAALVFHDGRRVPLQRQGRNWQASDEIRAARLYRLEFDGASSADEALHRIDVIPDRAPEIRVIHPERSLSLLEAGQSRWAVEFEASDDHGIVAAELELTLAQGSGENVAFSARTITLVPAGSVPGGPAPLTARYAQVLDFAALGLAAGDEVIVKLIVRDNRAPDANVTRSASFILRWPAEPASEAAGLEGVVQRALPAWFRSQRQIIIDSEALAAERGTLDAAAFLRRSDAIGVDQKILRLRYGQFLGEEFEGRQHAGEGPGGDAHDGHADDVAAGFGEAGNVLAKFGHVHDIAEAATLLDPETKETLRSALGEMWQAELHLRQGDPEQALPYEHRALEFIKKVQQATRIHLARVGLELPQVDEARRLSGDRAGLRDRAGTLAPAARQAPVLADLWQALAVGGGQPDWLAARDWLGGRGDALPEALAALAAVDRLERDPGCSECRDTLRKLLWQLLPTPPAAVVPPATPDAAGRAYLQALQSGSGGTR
jgi:hypothetical protein